MHFTLFIPGWTPHGGTDHQPLETIARQRGFADCLGQHDVMPINGDTPAGEGAGTLLGWLNPQNQLLEYRPTQQLWLPSVVRSDTDGQPLYFVGMWKEFEHTAGKVTRQFGPPTERELRRSYTQEGVKVKLGEFTWILPTPDTVDSRAVYADDGQSMYWEPLRQFAWMTDERKLMQDRYLNEGLSEQTMQFAMDPKEQCEWLLKLLRVNYRLLPELAVHLNLWTRKQHIMDTVLLSLGLIRKDASDG